MSFIRVNEVGDDSLERVNKLLHNIPGGVYKAAFSALRRAGDTAKTRAGQFAAAEYTINKGEFMRRVHSKTHITGGAGGVMGMSISFSGTVLPLLTFNTTYSRDGTVQTQVILGHIVALHCSVHEHREKFFRIHAVDDDFIVHARSFHSMAASMLLMTSSRLSTASERLSQASSAFS